MAQATSQLIGDGLKSKDQVPKLNKSASHHHNFFAVFGPVLPAQASARPENKTSSRSNLYLVVTKSRVLDSKYLVKGLRV